jgi:hypothetical protein
LASPGNEGALPAPTCQYRQTCPVLGNSSPPPGHPDSGAGCYFADDFAA